MIKAAVLPSPRRQPEALSGSMMIIRRSEAVPSHVRISGPAAAHCQSDWPGGGVTSLSHAGESKT
jgi:hypothetical protein